MRDEHIDFVDIEPAVSRTVHIEEAMRSGSGFSLR